MGQRFFVALGHNGNFMINFSKLKVNLGVVHFCFQMVSLLFTTLQTESQHHKAHYCVPAKFKNSIQQPRLLLNPKQVGKDHLIVAPTKNNCTIYPSVTKRRAIEYKLVELMIQHVLENRTSPVHMGCEDF